MIPKKKYFRKKDFMSKFSLIQNYRILFLGFLMIILLSLTAFAQTTPNIKPGLWEYTSTVTGTGVVLPPDFDKLPPEKQEKFRKMYKDLETKPHTYKSSECLTEEKIKKMELDANKSDKDCERSFKQNSSDTWTVTEHCKNDEGTEDSIIHYHVLSRTHAEISGEVTINAGGKVHKSEIKGDAHWESSDCGNKN